MMRKLYPLSVCLIGCCGGILCFSPGAIAQEGRPQGSDQVAVRPPLTASVLAPGPGQEFIFEAPTKPRPVKVPPNPMGAMRYRVDVRDTRPVILAAVREVAPAAFVKGDRIQAGIFSQRGNAAILQRNLQADGILATIADLEDGPSVSAVVTRNPATHSPGMTPPRPMATARYRVDVRETSPGILAAVREVAPAAFVKGDRIQAGVFSQRDNAAILQRDLRASGILATIEDHEDRPSPATVIASDPSRSSTSTTGTAGYYVAIPNRSSGASIQTRLRQLGISPQLIQSRSQPRGAHIAIGPFAERAQAELMNERVRDGDLDARLYFQG